MTFASRRDEWIHRALLLTLAFAIFAFGAVHRWSSAVVEIAVWSLAIASFWPTRARADERATTTSRTVVVCGVALIVYCLFQSAPLPPEWIESLSPQTAAFYRETVGVIAAAAPIPLSPMPAEAAHLAAMVESSRGPLPDEWRSLALHPYAGRAEVLRVAAYFLVMLVASRLRRPRRFLGALVRLGIFVAIFALVQGATWNGYVLWFYAPYDTGPRPLLTRLTGPFVNPDHFALLLELVLATAAALLLDLTYRILRRLRTKRSVGDLTIRAALLAVGSAIVLGGLLGTASRGGIVGGLLGLVVTAMGWTFMKFPERPSPERKKTRRRGEGARRWALRALPLAMAVGIVISGLLYAGPRARTELDVRLSQSLTEPDLGYRVELWNQSVDVVRDFSVFGVGLQSWGEMFPRYQRFPMLGVSVHHAHNDYVEWATEVGWIGVILVLLLGAAYLRWCFANREIPVVFKFGGFGALVAILWHEFFDFGLRVPGNSLVLAALLGLMANPYWRAERTARPPRGGLIRQRVSRALARWGTQPPKRRHRSDASAAAPSVTPAAAGIPVRRGNVLAFGVLLATVTCLTVGSARKLAESFLWRAASQGSLRLALTPLDATTWFEVGRHLPDSPEDYRRLKSAIYRRAISLRPAYQSAYLALARLEDDPVQRLRIVDAAISANPTEASVRLARATLLDDAGRSAEALGELERTAHSIPLAKEHSYLGSASEKLHSAAREAVNRGLLRALAERPSDPTLMNEVAQIYAAEARWEEAGDLWSRAADVSRDWGSYGWAVGESYGHAGLYERAEGALRKAIDEAPEEGLSYLTLAISVLLPQGKTAEAEAVIKQALGRPLRQVKSHAKQRATLMEALYRVRWAADDRRGAVAALREAAKIERGDARLQYELGLAYLRMESYDLASAALGRATSLDGGNALYHYYQGVALEKTEQLPEAIAAYQRANQLLPNSSTLQALVRVMDAAGRAQRRAN